jgi:hypothetical protein
MPHAFDGTKVLDKLEVMNCGGTPIWDYPSACAYWYDHCNAIIGSIGQSSRCKLINQETTT